MLGTSLLSSEPSSLSSNQGHVLLLVPSLCLSWPLPLDSCYRPLGLQDLLRSLLSKCWASFVGVVPVALPWNLTSSCGSWCSTSPACFRLGVLEHVLLCLLVTCCLWKELKQGFCGNGTDTISAQGPEKPARTLSGGSPSLLPLSFVKVWSSPYSQWGVSRLLVPLAQGSCPCTASGHPWSFLEPRAALLLRCLEVNLRLQARWQGHGIRLLFAQKHSNLNDFLLSFFHTELWFKKKMFPSFLGFWFIGLFIKLIYTWLWNLWSVSTVVSVRGVCIIAYDTAVPFVMFLAWIHTLLIDLFIPTNPAASVLWGNHRQHMRTFTCGLWRKRL